MNLNEFAREVHANARAHGWWDEDRDTAEIIALIHSEWSEALEEYRAGRPMVWHECLDEGQNPEDRPVVCEQCIICYYYGTDCECRGQKPEGIAVELIDGCIRILDYLAKVNYEIINFRPAWYIADVFACGTFVTFPAYIAYLHKRTSDVYTEHNTNKYLCQEMMGIVDTIFCWAIHNGLDPEKIILEKHEYNKTRPYRHGGKRC